MRGDAHHLPLQNNLRLPSPLQTHLALGPLWLPAMATREFLQLSHTPEYLRGRVCGVLRGLRVRFTGRNEEEEEEEEEEREGEGEEERGGKQPAANPSAFKEKRKTHTPTHLFWGL